MQRAVRHPASDSPDRRHIRPKDRQVQWRTRDFVLSYTYSSEPESRLTKPLKQIPGLFCFKFRNLGRLDILRDLDHVSRRQRIRRAVDHGVRHRQSLQNLELGSEIAAELHRLPFNLVV